MLAARGSARCTQWPSVDLAPTVSRSIADSGAIAVITADGLTARRNCAVEENVDEAPSWHVSQARYRFRRAEMIFIWKKAARLVAPRTGVCRRELSAYA
jgi:hypothetical protein